MANKIAQFGYNQYSLLAAIKPPYATISETRTPFKDVIKSIYLGEKINPSVTLLHYKMLEELCETYLRSDFVDQEIRIDYCLLRTGKTMPVVDIAYKSKTDAICYAQVTFADEDAERKANELVKFAKNDELDIKTIMFSMNKDLHVDGLLKHFNIEDIFNRFFKNPNHHYTKMIYDMIGLTSINEEEIL